MGDYPTDSEVRLEALRLAVDSMACPGEPAAETAHRAKTYFEFLRGLEPVSSERVATHKSTPAMLSPAEAAPILERLNATPGKVASIYDVRVTPELPAGRPDDCVLVTDEGNIPVRIINHVYEYRAGAA